MNRPAYFPLPYPGELFYSLVARYCSHVGSPKMMYAQESLFGRRFVIAAYDLPGHLDAFAERLANRKTFSADDVIDSMSLFGYFAAFEPEELRIQIRQAMHVGAKDIHVRLGISAFRIGRLSQLQFCPMCFEEMLDQHGELYWRREHQLPGVFVCPLHGCGLLKSDIKLPDRSRHEFIAATPKNCALNAEAVIKIADDDALSALWQLAKRCSEVLNHPPKAMAAAAWAEFYHEKMISAGFSKSSAKMNQQRFLEEFHRYCDDMLACTSCASTICASCESWAAKLVRKHRHANHPLYHLLLQNFLDQQGEVSHPFGLGPWPCFNPLAVHSEPNPIRTIRTHRNREKLVGVFQCECGYAYTRNVSSETASVGPPRLLRYGPLLSPVLRDAIAKGTGLRALGRSLGMDPKTVVTLARNLNIPNAWKLPRSAYARKQVRVNEITPRRAKNRPTTEQPESLAVRSVSERWANIDNDYASRIPAMVAAIVRVNPPIRITVAELERRTNRRSWIYKNRTHLPRTSACLKGVIETTEAFQIRRIRRAIETQLKSGSAVRAWRVMREAGIPSGLLGKINAIIAEMMASPMTEEN